MAYKYSEDKKTIVIAHPSRKKHYLQEKSKNPYLNMEVINLNELKGMFDYNYDDRALCFLLSKDFNYKVAKDLLSAFTAHHYERGVEVKKYDDLRNELIAKRYLYKLPYPEKTFQDADIIVSGYYSEDETIKEYLGEVNIIHDEDDLNEEPTKTYLSFSDIYEELHYVFNQIATDLDQGTPIDNVFVYGVNDDYTSLLGQFSKYYGFTINKEVACRLYDTNIYRFFRNAYLETDLESSIKAMRDEFKDSKDADKIERFSRVYETVFPGNKEKTVAIFDDVAKSDEKLIPSKKNVVTVLDEAVCPNDAHLYFLNFSMGAYPKAPSEGGFFSDEEKERIGLETAKSRSRKDSSIIEHALRSKTLKLITFSEDIFGATKFECAFKDKHSMVATKNPRSAVEYAKDKGTFLCASLQDSKRNYLQEDARRSVYESITNVSLDYSTYDSSFKGKKTGRAKGKKHSYSSLKTYRECPFKYLFSKVLYLENHEPNFGASVGNVFHGVFEQYYEDPTLDFDTLYDRSLKKEQGLIKDPASHGHDNKVEFDLEQKAIMENLKDYCKMAFEFQKHYEKYLQNVDILSEKPFYVPLDNGVLVDGRFDKIITFDYDNKKYCFIVDFKTNSERFNEKLFRNFGLSFQLPLYAMGLSRDENLFKDKTDLKDVKLAGLFIAPVLNFSLENEKGKELSSEDNKALKLCGVFLNDIGFLLKIDPMMEKGYQSIDGSYIDGLQLKTNLTEFYKPGEFPKAKSEDQIKELESLAEGYIKSYDERINNGDFSIDPLVIKNTMDACKYCQFHDVCFINKSKIKQMSINGDVVLDEEDKEDGERTE